jgi:very-short-patch-repair endonuclease
LKFRRQQILGGFVVDFYCAGLRLAIELDGGVHADPKQREYDAIRSAILSNLAIRIVRVANDHVDEPFLRELLAPYALDVDKDRSRD